MANTPYSNQKHLVILAKEFFRRGCKELVSWSAISRIQAVINFDDAVEMALLSAVNMLNCSITPDVKLNNLYKSVNESLGVFENQLGCWTSIDIIHKTRNLAKHQGQFVDIDAARRCEALCESVLQEILHKCLKLDMHDISTALLINEQSVRKAYERADEYLVADEHDKAIFSAMEAYILAKPPEFGIFGDFEYFDTAELDSIAIEHPRIARSLAQLAMDIGHIRRLQALSLIGVDVLNWRTFQALAPKVKYTEGGFELYWRKDIRDHNRYSAWILEFVLETLLKWQDIGVGPGTAGIAISPEWPISDEYELAWRVSYAESHEDATEL